MLGFMGSMALGGDKQVIESQNTPAQGAQTKGPGEFKMEFSITTDSLKGHMTTDEGQICGKYLEMKLDSLEPTEETEKARVGSVYNLFIDTYGKPSESVKVGTGEVKKKNIRKCATVIFRLGQDVKSNTQKFNAQWVAHFIMAPDLLLPKPTGLTPDEYQTLSQDERISRIREIDPENIYMIPRSIRESDYNRAKAMGLKVTHGTFGLADAKSLDRVEVSNDSKELDKIRARNRQRAYERAKREEGRTQ